MNDNMEPQEPAEELVFEYELDAPLEKVWRAISVPALRERWLPSGALADAEPLASVPREEVSYRMRDSEPPFLESMVTFQVLPNAVGGTKLRIIHGPADARLERQPPRAANNNGPCLMRAA
jgi:uncharacterized protein YndB with AHSA1/START domain